MSDTAKKRRPFGAAALTLLTPGLGQLYNGMPRRAALFFAINFAIYVLLHALNSSVALRSSAAFGLAAAILVPALGFYIFMIVDAFRGARRVGQLELRRYNRWYVYVPAILAAAGLNAAIGFTPIHTRSFSLPSVSMAPTLNAGDRIFVSAHAYRARIPERGELVVFERTDGSGAIFIKRLIGLPGDSIEVRGGILHINDVPVKREIVDGPPPIVMEAAGMTQTGTMYRETFADGRNHNILEITDTRASDNTREYRVPQGHYFMMGDNRDNSTDSRFPQIGFIPHENLRGKVMYIFWSRDLSRIGTVVE